MSPIDRKKLVRRHNPLFREWNPRSPLTVGNGDFAFTADFTGLQSLIETAPGDVPLCTMSQKGFHSYPDAPQGYGDLKLKEYSCGGRTVGYMTDPSGQEELFKGLRVNPHRFHLANIGLYLEDETGTAALPERNGGADFSQFTDLLQNLDLWTGVMHSEFRYKGSPVSVGTVCHPRMDLISVRMESPLAGTGRAGLELAFPYGSHTISGADWHRPEGHRSVLSRLSPEVYRIGREMDGSSYTVTVAFREGSSVKCRRMDGHGWIFTSDTEVLEFSVLISSGREEEPLPLFNETCILSGDAWESYWQDGAALSFEGSTDPGAEELERRIILSQYLLGLQSLGSLPPAETGLTCNSWYGKFHLEMHVWHALHGLLWNRTGLVEKSLGWYHTILPSARERAVQQGYKGVRWPKMTDESGNDSPSPIGTLLCWQQPHPILFAELIYRMKPSAGIIENYGTIVEETAEFMADYALFDKEKGRYILGPPLIPAQENHAPEQTLNPCFELEYWRWALKTAILWKERQGNPVPANWRDVLSGLSPCPVDEERNSYAAHENCRNSYTEFGTDHPSMLLACGFLPGESTDPGLMSNSYDEVLKNWKMETMWGWDFPSMAMTLARLGRRSEAVEALLMDSPKNIYLPNGHNRQQGHDDLPLYLPGNGALLLAAAMMAAGWDGSSGEAPGFPDDGSWKVKGEGFSPYI